MFMYSYLLHDLSRNLWSFFVESWMESTALYGDPYVFLRPSVTRDTLNIWQRKQMFLAKVLDNEENTLCLMHLFCKSYGMWDNETKRHEHVGMIKLSLQFLTC